MPENSTDTSRSFCVFFRKKEGCGWSCKFAILLLREYAKDDSSHSEESNLKHRKGQVESIKEKRAGKKAKSGPSKVTVSLTFGHWTSTATQNMWKYGVRHVMSVGAVVMLSFCAVSVLPGRGASVYRTACGHSKMYSVPRTAYHCRWGKGPHKLEFRISIRRSATRLQAYENDEMHCTNMFHQSSFHIVVSHWLKV